MKTLHMQATVNFVIEAVRDLERRGAPQDYVTAGGQPVSYADAYAYLAKMKADGYEFVPCCENVDERGRCRGVV